MISGQSGRWLCFWGWPAVVLGGRKELGQLSCHLAGQPGLDMWHLNRVQRSTQGLSKARVPAVTQWLLPCSTGQCNVQGHLTWFSPKRAQIRSAKFLQVLKLLSLTPMPKSHPPAMPTLIPTLSWKIPRLPLGGKREDNGKVPFNVLITSSRAQSP